MRILFHRAARLNPILHQPDEGLIRKIMPVNMERNLVIRVLGKVLFGKSIDQHLLLAGNPNRMYK